MYVDRPGKLFPWAQPTSHVGTSKSAKAAQARRTTEEDEAPVHHAFFRPRSLRSSPTAMITDQRTLHANSQGLAGVIIPDDGKQRSGDPATVVIKADTASGAATSSSPPASARVTLAPDNLVFVAETNLPTRKGTHAVNIPPSSVEFSSLTNAVHSRHISRDSVQGS